MKIRIPSHRPCLGPAELEQVRRVLDTRWLGTGALTREFEDTLRAYLGVKHVLSVNSGTAALHMALDAVGLEPGDEVVLPSLTFVSSAQAVLAVGARPVFCEVLPGTLTIDVADAARHVTPRTRALIPVHYGGRVCDMDAVRRLADQRHLAVVEDAAHAFGSTWNGRFAGTLGDAGCFSFDPIKNITCGGGGAVATNNDALAARIRPRRNVGIDVSSWDRIESSRPWLYDVVSAGFRYQMSDLNAGIGLAQFEKLDAFRRRKCDIVARYDSALAATPGLVPIRHAIDGVFPFNYVVRVVGGQRDALMLRLREKGIGATVQFHPCHLHAVFRAGRQELPVTEQLGREIVTLPLYVEMSDADVEEVVSVVTSFLRQESFA